MGSVIAWIMRHYKTAVWIYRGVLALLLLQAALGYGGPEAARLNWLAEIEDWLTAKTRDPIMVAFLVGLVCSTWLLPDAWKWWKKYFPTTNRTTLSVSGPHLHQSHPVIKCWRLIVQNGPTVASNVKMRLINIVPRPRYAAWFADYPYPLRSLAAGAAEVRINPNEEEHFEAVSGWPNSEEAFFTRGLDTKSADNPIRIEPDERWELQYAVTAENADPVYFSLEMFIENGAVMATRKP
jgi:hypothetical protein